MLVFCQLLRSENNCRARRAARFSAISSRRAALDRDERSDVEIQGEDLDDRRERARPGVADDMYGNLLPIIVPSVEQDL